MRTFTIGMGLADGHFHSIRKIKEPQRKVRTLPLMEDRRDALHQAQVEN